MMKKRVLLDRNERRKKNKKVKLPRLRGVKFISYTCFSRGETICLLHPEDFLSFLSASQVMRIHFYLDKINLLLFFVPFL
jgi:hypothetical protein